MNADDGPERPAAGLYLHVPFCSAVCPYCDFAVQVGRPAIRERYVEALLTEMRAWTGIWLDPIDTIYFGGGTPSLLSATALARILDAVGAALPVAGNPKVYLEANPEDVDSRSVKGWRELGVDVVSLGIQSFVDQELGALGRRHDAAAARRAVAACLEAGFETVSVDLIFGIPGQTVEALDLSLDEVVALGPAHVSCYQLTVHEGTTFGRWRNRGKFQEMNLDDQAGLFEHAHRRLADAGWHAYEVSNFARAARHRSAHNLKYWNHVPYLGLGPSSHSFDGRSRWWNLRALADYEAALAAGRRPLEGSEELSPSELALEALMLALRTADGVDLEAFRARYGVDLQALNGPLIAVLVGEGLYLLSHGRLTPTRRGLAVADGIAARFALEA